MEVKRGDRECDPESGYTRGRRMVLAKVLVARGILLPLRLGPKHAAFLKPLRTRMANRGATAHNAC